MMLYMLLEAVLDQIEHKISLLNLKITIGYCMEIFYEVDLHMHQ